MNNSTLTRWQVVTKQGGTCPRSQAAQAPGQVGVPIYTPLFLNNHSPKSNIPFTGKLLHSPPCPQPPPFPSPLPLPLPLLSPQPLLKPTHGGRLQEVQDTLQAAGAVTACCPFDPPRTPWQESSPPVPTTNLQRNRRTQ